jgi:hypothetical protein
VGRAVDRDDVLDAIRGFMGGEKRWWPKIVDEE